MRRPWFVALGPVLVVAGMAACTNPSKQASPPPVASASPTVTPTPVPIPSAISSETVAADAPECPAGKVSLEVGAQGAGGAIVIGLRIRSEAAPCRLSDPVSAVITDVGGTRQFVAGSPASTQPGLGIPPDGALQLFTWRNWCGPRATYKATVTAGGKSAVVQLPIPPRCDAPSSPSALTPAGP